MRRLSVRSEHQMSLTVVAVVAVVVGAFRRFAVPVLQGRNVAIHGDRSLTDSLTNFFCPTDRDSR